MVLKHPKRIKVTTDREAAAAMDAVRQDGIPRIVERDGEEIAAIVKVEDVRRRPEWNPTREAIERALRAGGSWRALGGEDLAEKIHRWRREAPDRPPLQT